MVVSNKQEFPIIVLVDEFPFLQGVIEGVLRLERQRHHPIIALTVHRGCKPFKPFHRYHQQTVWCIKRHAG